MGKKNRCLRVKLIPEKPKNVLWRGGIFSPDASFLTNIEAFDALSREEKMDCANLRVKCCTHAARIGSPLGLDQLKLRVRIILRGHFVLKASAASEPPRSGQKQTTATRRCPTLLTLSLGPVRRETHRKPGKPAAFDFTPPILHHFRRRIHAPSGTLAPSSSHFQAFTAQHLFLPLSVGLMRILETSGRHFESHCVRACIRLGALLPDIHLYQNPRRRS